MAKDIHFFMTKNDFIEVLRKSEENISLKYVEAKAYSSKEIKEYYSLEEYEDDYLGEIFICEEKVYFYSDTLFLFGNSYGTIYLVIAT